MRKFNGKSAKSVWLKILRQWRRHTRKQEGQGKGQKLGCVHLRRLVSWVFCARFLRGSLIYNKKGP